MYHFTSLLIHIVNVFLVYGLVYHLSNYIAGKGEREKRRNGETENAAAVRSPSPLPPFPISPSSRLIAGIVAGPSPNTGADGTVANGRINVEPLPSRLFTGDDHVDVVAAAQTVIRDRQKAVCIGRQIDAHDVGFLIRDMIDKAGILVGKAIVILSPDMRREEVIQRCDRLAPGDRPADL